MTSITKTRSPIHPAGSKPFADALESVRDELVAMPREDVVPLGDDLDRLLAVLPEIQVALAAANGREKVRLERLEVLALAFVRAQHECLWQPPRHPIVNYDRLFQKATFQFREIEDLVAQAVGRGQLDHRSVPRVGGKTLLDRCQHILRVVEVLREHGMRPKWHSLEATEDLALRILNGYGAVRGELTRAEIRERAYTALRRALAAHEQMDRGATNVPAESGVLVIDLGGGAEARAHRA